MSGWTIRASEIGPYAYCVRAWWLDQARGLAPANVEELAHGNEFPTQHGRAIAPLLNLRRLAVIPVELTTPCLMMALLLWEGEP